MSSSSTAGLAAFFAAAVAAAGIGAGAWPGHAAAASVDLGHSEVALPAVAAAPATGGKRISFGDLSFDPVRTPPGDAADYRTAPNGKGLRFVQFDGKVRGDWLADLAAFGARPLQYYPDDTFLVWADAGAARAVEGLAHVRWQGEYRPDWKLEPGLGKRAGVIRNVGVHFYNDGDVAAVLAALAAQGANVVTHGPAQADRTFFDAWVEVDAARLADLAALPQVVWLEFADPDPILDDEMSSQIVARNYNATFVPQTGYLSWLGALGFNGNGVTWSVIDSGVDLTHPDFAGRIVGGVTYPGCPAGNGPGDDPSSGGHGTHVAGIIAGSGAAGFSDAQGFLYGIGVAPAAGIFAQNPICAGGVPWPPAGGWQILSKNALLGGAVGGNGSWTSGESGGTTYTAGARAWDQIVRDGDFDTPMHEAFTMVFSAGNSGPNAGTLTAPKAAKNPIITGSSRNFRAGSINDLSGFSSRGPTQDGRFGVTVSAPGETIASARRIAGASQCASAIAGTSNTYAFCSGTSMAAPHVSGVAVLLTQWWRGFNGNATPSPAMIKALLVNGARDLSGVPAGIPNPNEGWGRIDIPGSMGLDFTASEYVDQSQVLTSVGQVYEITYGVADPSRPLKVSLAWTDAAAATGANPALVNNLDLQVITGGQTYRGNVFTNGASVPGGSADNLNNVENVFVTNPGSDVTIRVIASNLPGDGIPGNGTPTDQDFALVCRNCSLGAGFSLTPTPTSRAICTPANATYDLSLGSLLGFNEPVTLAATGTPAGTTTSFSVNPVPTLPGTSLMTIGNTGSAAAGAYQIDITGTASPSGEVRSASVDLLVATAVPGAPSLTAPANNATNVIVQPTLSWASASQAEGYLLEVATDAGFGNIVLSTVVAGTSFALTTPLNTNTSYWWRVRASNVCGDGANSPVFRFTTQPAPGDCAPGATPVDVFTEDFSGGLGGFSTAGSTGASTWAISTVRPSPLSG
ncbi:MAG: S8 family serine peptidase, partial [Pseudoxanthomonas sp.]|nr:S8 family serine peptidase [Pseudoxanthomonas sp.]